MVAGSAFIALASVPLFTAPIALIAAIPLYIGALRTSSRIQRLLDNPRSIESATVVAWKRQVLVLRGDGHVVEIVLPWGDETGAAVTAYLRALAPHAAVAHRPRSHGAR